MPSIRSGGRSVKNNKKHACSQCGRTFDVSRREVVDRGRKRYFYICAVCEWEGITGRLRQ
jgi:transcription elongation factor Elf1